MKSNLTAVAPSVSRPEDNLRSAAQVREKEPVRESIHSDTILNLCPVDASTLLTGSKDRVCNPSRIS